MAAVTRPGVSTTLGSGTIPEANGAFGFRMAAEIDDGPVFRAVTKHDTPGRRRPTAQSVALVVKNAFRTIGRRPRDDSAHSLRSGLVIATAIGGTDERTIMRHTGHKPVAMVRRYMRDANLFRDNPAVKARLQGACMALSAGLRLPKQGLAAESPGRIILQEIWRILHGPLRERRRHLALRSGPRARRVLHRKASD